jgi:hypothetical protein
VDSGFPADFTPIFDVTYLFLQLAPANDSRFTPIAPDHAPASRQLTHPADLSQHTRFLTFMFIAQLDDS